jgi:sortase A
VKTASSALIVVGVLVLAWTFFVWRWNDPFTSLYTRWEQHKLADQYEALDTRYRGHRLPTRSSPAEAVREIRGDARRFRVQAPQGAAIGRIIVPRLGLNMVLVNGTDTATLKKGPGRDPRTYMPGEDELIYIAGHRTTYLAPFARIDTLRPGDRVTLRVPYGTFDYKVTRHRIVESHNLSVLRSHHHEEVALQACHPRFFATHRYIVWAEPIRVTLRGGRSYVP